MATPARTLATGSPVADRVQETDVEALRALARKKTYSTICAWRVGSL